MPLGPCDPCATFILLRPDGRGVQLALDHSPHVRECSCFCLGQFAEHCQPEILDHSEEVLPIVFRLLDDATDNVKVGTSVKLSTCQRWRCIWLTSGGIAGVAVRCFLVDELTLALVQGFDSL